MWFNQGNLLTPKYPANMNLVTEKRRIIKDLASLSPEIKAQLSSGISKRIRTSKISYTDKNGKNFWLVPFETAEVFYMVRIPVTYKEREIKDLVLDSPEYFDNADDQDGSLYEDYRDDYEDDY